MRRRSAQACVEMAIFGSLIILVFSFLLSYIQRLHDRHYVTMEAFRRALQKANHNNAIVSYTIIETKRDVDLSTPYKGTRTSRSASASVYWAVPPVGEEPTQLVYYKVDEEEFDVDPEDFKVEEITTSAHEEAQEEFTKKETPQGITTTRSLTLSDTVIYRFKDKEGNILKEITHRISEDGKYRPEGEGFTRGRTWSTDF